MLFEKGSERMKPMEYIRELYLMAGILAGASLLYIIFFNPNLNEISPQTQWELILGIFAITLFNSYSIKNVEVK